MSDGSKTPRTDSVVLQGLGKPWEKEFAELCIHAETLECELAAFQTDVKPLLDWVEQISEVQANYPPFDKFVTKHPSLAPTGKEPS